MPKVGVGMVSGAEVALQVKDLMSTRMWQPPSTRKVRAVLYFLLPEGDDNEGSAGAFASSSSLKIKDKRFSDDS
jgi:hypothetical protein